MTTRNRPNYGIYYLLLTVAGSMELPIVGTRVVMAAALQGASLAFLPGGVQELTGGTPVNALMNVQVGKSLGDAIPFTVGSKVHVGNKFDYLRLSWAAQAGVVAMIMISDDADDNGIDIDAPPTVSIGTVTISQGGNTALVTGTGALKVDPSAVTQPVALQGGGTPATVSNPALNALPQSSAAGAPQVQANVLGASSYISTSLSAGLTTLLSAASNTHGVVIRRALIQSGAASGNGIFAGTVAPTSLTSNVPIAIWPGVAQGVDVLTHDVFLPAGQGIFIWTNNATWGAVVNWDIL